MNKDHFKNGFSRNIYQNKYALTQTETWPQRGRAIVDSVCGTEGGTVRPILSQDEMYFLIKAITERKFMHGGRYIYSAGRAANFYKN